MDALKLIAQDSMKAEVPNIEIGDTIKIDVNIREGERERIQVFEGTVIARKGSGVSETFTVCDNISFHAAAGVKSILNLVNILKKKINNWYLNISIFRCTYYCKYNLLYKCSQMQTFL